ncbi:hypothetical protein ANACOL_03211 [Anaerotruncus colihominis DSM 17241]|uniref:Uncharacterized protein n=1 Tax=Anaerotruncus colihominis DSM 17241 TaxID=445972 RepID=B0PDQ6_9FIRM|nr:hypothetical protein ANACOL_03211 [Anaerotruncus colihominis DSM 17241]
MQSAIDKKLAICALPALGYFIKTRLPAERADAQKIAVKQLFFILAAIILLIES